MRLFQPVIVIRFLATHPIDPRVAHLVSCAENMKKQIAYLLMAGSLSLVSFSFSTGCAVTSGREGASAYAEDKTIATKIKTTMYSDPVVKGTEVGVTVLNGQVQLSGFVDTADAKNRAGQIASSTHGVTKVFNNIVVGTQPAPTGR
jgi:hyperosmotically inducible protein